LLTVEKVYNEKKEFNKNYFDKVINLHKIITSIRYNEIITLLPNVDFDPEILRTKYNKSNLNQAFSWIHKESVNFEIFEQLFGKLTELNYSNNTIKLINKLENIIIKKKFYEKIRPDKHYSFLHGDFNRSNILFNKEGQCKVIDWSNLKIGPPVLDMVQFFKAFDLPFPQIYNIYLSKRPIENEIDVIETILFIYALIVIVWFQKMDKVTIDNQNDKYLLPATEYLEMLALKMGL
jgi:thiamine kinase-like enzyme